MLKVAPPTFLNQWIYKFRISKINQKSTAISITIRNCIHYWLLRFKPEDWKIWESKVCIF